MNYALMSCWGCACIDSYQTCVLITGLISDSALNLLWEKCCSDNVVARTACCEGLVALVVFQDHAEFSYVLNVDSQPDSINQVLLSFIFDQLIV